MWNVSFLFWGTRFLNVQGWAVVLSIRYLKSNQDNEQHENQKLNQGEDERGQAQVLFSISTSALLSSGQALDWFWAGYPFKGSNLEKLLEGARTP